jgi:hypothetical protein
MEPSRRRRSGRRCDNPGRTARRCALDLHLPSYYTEGGPLEVCQNRALATLVAGRGSSGPAPLPDLLPDFTIHFTQLCSIPSTLVPSPATRF